MRRTPQDDERQQRAARMNGIYDPILVATSVVVAILASYVALDLASSVTVARGWTRRLWLAGGSLAMGMGIWSMHFIGMLAFSLPGMAISYDVPLLALSIAVAVAASAIALYVVSRARATPRHFGYGGVAMGAAICGMHYIGMWGMHMPARIEWRGSLVLASIVIAVAASFAALFLAYRYREESRREGARHRLAAGTAMGAAISGMHYTAMFAAVFVPVSGTLSVDSSDVLATDGLAIAVTGSTLLVLTLALVGSVIERELSRRTVMARENARLYRDAQAEIARRERAQQALREHEEQLRLAMEAGRMGSWQLDPEAERLTLSDFCRDMHGLDEGFGGGLDELGERIHSDDRTGIMAALRGAKRGDGEFAAEYRVLLPGGEERWVQARGRHRAAGPGRPARLIGVCIDVTDSRRIEQQLRQSQKMDAIGQLAGGVAHDFNNLLTVVQGHVDFLLDSVHDSDPRRQEVEEIRRAAERAAGLTGQLLSFARRQVLQPKVLDLADVVRETERLVRRLVPEHIALETDLRGPAPVRADPTQVEQILVNLVVNGKDALPDGGRIDVQVAPVELREPLPAHGESIPAGRYARLAVADTGSGMEPAVVERAFEPFYTTKPAGEGTGLGLATVYGIAKQMEGYVRIESEPGAGSRFEVYLRACAAAGEPAAEPQPRTEQPRRAGILVVEDEPGVRRLVRRLLERLGHRVIEAGSGDEALERIATAGSDLQLMVSDVVMPGMSASELAARAHERLPHIRILFMSGYTADTLMRRGIAEAQVEFIQKPFTPEDLARRVAKLLEQEEREGDA